MYCVLFAGRKRGTAKKRAVGSLYNDHHQELPYLLVHREILPVFPVEWDLNFLKYEVLYPSQMSDQPKLSTLSFYRSLLYAFLTEPRLLSICSEFDVSLGGKTHKKCLYLFHQLHSNACA